MCNFSLNHTTNLSYKQSDILGGNIKMKKVSLASLILASGLVVAACGTGEDAKSEQVKDAPKEEIKEEIKDEKEEVVVEDKEVIDAVEDEKEEPKVEEKPVEKPTTTTNKNQSTQEKPAQTQPTQKPSTNQSGQANSGNSPSGGNSSSTGNSGAVVGGQGSSNTGSGNTSTETKPENDQPSYTFTPDSILSKVKAAYGSNYLPNMAMDKTMVAETFKLDMSLVDAFVAEQPMIGFHPDRVLIVKAKEGKVNQVVAQLEATRKQMIADAMTYPANMEKLQSTKVVHKDNYAAFFMVGSSENMAEDPEERLHFAETEVQKAVSAFYSMFK